MAMGKNELEPGAETAGKGVKMRLWSQPLPSLNPSVASSGYVASGTFIDLGFSIYELEA